MLTINTKTQLITFLLFALLVHNWSLNVLLAVMMALLILLIWVKNSHFFKLMRRLKWFYLVMLLIFIFNTPGEHILGWPFSVKPTYEGLYRGAEQVLRIAVMLAVLSVILTQNTKQQLISGLYFLMRPLACSGLNVKQFAARLWLTLHYVDMQQAKHEKPRLTGYLGQYLNQIPEDETHDDVLITLNNPQQTWVDYTMIMLMAALFVFESVL